MGKDNYEEFLQEVIFPELEKGRPNWDKPHTEAVVEHIKSITSNTPELDLNIDVLIIAAYAHDWGYSGLFENGTELNLADINDTKVAHMKIGGQKLSKLLESERFDFLSKEEKQRAVHLVQVHDSLAALKDPDELVLMEADTLGGLDITKITPAFDKDSEERYMQGVRNKRYPLFITNFGKEQFKKLYKSREDFYTKKQTA